MQPPKSTCVGEARPAVLLLHGLCANPLEMLPLAGPLRRAGYAVATPHLPGYGMPDGKARPADLGSERPRRFEDWIGAALAQYDALSARHPQVIVGGLCMGAVLSIAVTLQRRPAALVLLSTTLHFDGWNVSPWRWLLPLAYLPGLRERLSFREAHPFGLKNASLRQWVAREMATRQSSMAGAARLPASFLHQASRLLRHVRPRLSQVRIPSVVLHAKEDDVSGPRSVNELRTQLGHPPEVHWFHDSYHMLTLDNERAAVATAVRDFLLRTAPAPAALPPLHPATALEPS